MATIQCTREGAIARVVISNPARRNAMTMSMWLSLAQTVRDLDADLTVRAIVLQGDGDRAFVSGADISEFQTNRSDPAGVQRYDRAVAQAQDALATCGTPTIAFITGVCYGGGLGLAISCDLRYASTEARFCMPAARLGLGYARAGLKHFVDVLGAARSKELFLTARVFDGAEAARIGLVHQAFDPAVLCEQVERQVAAIAAHAPLTLRAVKLGVRDLLADPAAQDSAAVDLAVQQCFESNDYREGRQAFLEKRPPRFTSN